MWAAEEVAHAVDSRVAVDKGVHTPAVVADMDEHGSPEVDPILENNRDGKEMKEFRAEAT